MIYLPGLATMRHGPMVNDLQFSYLSNDHTSRRLSRTCCTRRAISYGTLNRYLSTQRRWTVQ